ncbi:MAG: hypothetical protein P8Y71_11115 [Pseudolabrys sp.]|jgi:hypothetical protein
MLMSQLGHSLPAHSAPKANDVSYASALGWPNGANHTAALDVARYPPLPVMGVLVVEGECESGGALLYPFVTIGGGALPLPIGALPLPTQLATLRATAMATPISKILCICPLQKLSAYKSGNLNFP